MASAFDPNRWTTKTREAFQAAAEQATTAGHPEVTPEHLLAALLSQADGVVRPMLERAGTAVGEVRNRLRRHRQDAQDLGRSRPAGVAAAS